MCVLLYYLMNESRNSEVMEYDRNFTSDGYY